MNRDKVVVTGGMGFIGRNICELLLSEGYEVHIIDNYCTTDLKGVNNYKYKIYKDHSEYLLNNLEDQNDGVIFHRMTILNTKRIPEVMKDAKYVFHTAAVPRVEPSIQNPLESNSINIQGSLAIFFAAKEAGVERIIFSSSSSVYGDTAQVPTDESVIIDPLSPYALQKYAAERYLELFDKLYGTNSVSLRYFNVYGEFQPESGSYVPVMGIFFRQYAKKEPLTVTGDGETERDFVNVTDVARANLLAATNSSISEGHHIFNIGTGSSFTINQIAKQINDNIMYISPRVEPRKTKADITKAKEVLGWEPEVFLFDWINENKPSV